MENIPYENIKMIMRLYRRAIIFILQPNTYPE